MSQVPGAYTRTVVLRISHDRHPGTGLTDAQLIALSTVNEGRCCSMIADAGERFGWVVIPLGTS